MLPKAQAVLGYKDFFGENPPKNKLNLINFIDRNNLIAEFSALNYRLKPKNNQYYDTSLESQVKELEYFCSIDKSQYREYKAIAEKYTKSKNDYPLIFTRRTCLFALEAIISSNISEKENFTMNKVEVWDAIFKFILSVNTEITTIEKTSNDGYKINFEKLNAESIPLNESSLDTEPLYPIFRGLYLINFLDQTKIFKKLASIYIDETYERTSEHFIFEVLNMFIANSHEQSIFDFRYKISDLDKRLLTFNKLSGKIDNKAHYKLLNIRKNPFYKINNNEFYLTDNIFLVEKVYSQFINDFWFEYIKPKITNQNKRDLNIKNYRSQIGYFFESYISELIKYSFIRDDFFNIKLFDELKFDGKEFLDIYIKNKNRIILGEVKSSSIYDEEKYSLDIQELYKGNGDKFFKNFGLNQIIDSIKNFRNEINNFDISVIEKKYYIIYPVLIFNEKALQTPLMSIIFQQKFIELLGDFKEKKLIIKPLSLIHVSDLEKIEDTLNKKPQEIFKILNDHCKDPKFMPPFFTTLNIRGYKPKYKRPKKLFKKLIDRYN